MTSKKKSAKTVDKQLVNKIVDSIMASVGIATMTDSHGRKWKDGKRIAVLPNYVDYKHCKECDVYPLEAGWNLNGDAKTAYWVISCPACHKETAYCLSETDAVKEWDEMND